VYLYYVLLIIILFLIPINIVVVVVVVVAAAASAVVVARNINFILRNLCFLCLSACVYNNILEHKKMHFLAASYRERNCR